MACTLLGTVAVITYRNAVEFQNILWGQLSDKAQTDSETALNSISSQVDFWKGHVQQIVKEAVQTRRYSAPAAKALIKASSDIVSFHLLEEKNKNVKTFTFLFTDNKNQNQFEDKDPDKIEKIIRYDNQLWVRKSSKAKKLKQIYLVNASTRPKLGLLRIAVPAVVGKKRVWGILTVWQRPLASSLPVSKQTEAYVINKRGRLLVSQGRNILKPKSLLKDGVTRLALKSSSNAGIFREKRKGSNILAAYARDDALGFSVILKRDPSSGIEQINRELMRTLLMTSFAFLIAIFITWVFADQLTRNLRILVDLTQLIASGNFQARVPATSKDEVAVLGNSINNMSSRIEELMSAQMEAVRQEKELETAKMVQETLFPKENINHVSIRLTGCYEPASECGGDWWGHFQTQSGLQFFCVADATGHGVAAAIVTALAFSSCMTFAEAWSEQYAEDPAKMLEKMNEVMWSAGRGVTTMTFFAAFLNPETKTLTFANAGHNHPFLMPKYDTDPRLNSNKKVKPRSLVLQARGIPLGLGPNASYKNKAIECVNDDKIFLYTDGLIECTNHQGEMYGKRKMMKKVESLVDQDIDTIREIALEDAMNFFEGYPQDDDITVVVADIMPTTPLKKVQIEGEMDS